MDSFVRTMRIIWRAELLIIEAKISVATKRIGATAFAGLICVFGLGMLNVAGFFALEEKWGPVYAALGVAVADFLIAALLVLWASRLSTGPELDLAREVRDAGLQELEARAGDIQDEVEAVRDELLAVKNSLVNFSRNPLDGTIHALLTPILTLLIKSLTKGKD
ncbi:phage holin family protein [uncultured Roseibium sp.]|uniref:phage holin family protein n=1 Tax=uncultured Roseibium sp. TaxID=1936171 RepID=UPI0026031521|nr:phage holin family protein [uncultured Roseibium sp.]